MSRLLDGLFEARRGLWPSALESFTGAAEDDPADPRAPLAAAICALRRGDARRAVVLLETAPALDDPGPPWAERAAWLRACARLALDDPAGAEAAARGLPGALRRRVEAAARLRAGDYRAGVVALLVDRVPGRVLGAEGGG